MPEELLRTRISRMRTGTAGAGGLIVLLLGVIALQGCASERQANASDAQLALLQKILPGHYDNATQVSADARAGVAGAHAPVDLLILPANAALIGKATYYVRQSASDDPRRVLSQRLWVFGRAVDVHTKAPYLEQRIYVFKEPQRWLEVVDDPELLQSLLPPDIQQLLGCELIWSNAGPKEGDKAAGGKTHSKGGADFEAHRQSESCRPSAKYSGQLVEQRFELHDNRLALIQQQIGRDGLLELTGSEVEPFYLFDRRAAAN
jgi:hypothetical protein